jgi:outer membrane protein assembly factor BamB
MATLEVHDGKGRVEYVSISRDNPALFGSDPKCDIVLSDPSILPFHGRLRFKGGKFKAEATPEAQAIVLNGQKVLASTFRQGDEIRVGSYRIFMLNPDDGPVDVEKTRVQSKPKGLARMERGDWAKGLEVAPPSVEGQAVANRGRRASGREGAGAEAPAVTAPPPPATPWGRLVRMLTSGDAPPGQERVITSPLVLGLAGTLTVLALLSFWLWGVIVHRTTESQYRHAMDTLEQGDYLNAIQAFDKFLAAHPKDPRAGKVKVLRALANVRQYTSGGSPIWTDAFDAAKEMVKTTGEEEAFQDSSADLAELVVKIGEGLADRAHAGADANTLAMTESAVKFHDRIGGPSAKTLRARSKWPGKLAEARAAVQKGQKRTSTLAKMDAAIKAGSAAKIFDARDALVTEYPDLANDKPLVERMTRGNNLLLNAVTFDKTRRAAESTPRTDPLGPPVSVVLRTQSSERPPASDGTSATVVFALSQGFAYGINGNTGAPLWHVPVGLSAPFPPLAVQGSDSAALVFDARHNELVRLDSKTGALAWRQSLGERITDPPLVVGRQVMQTTPGGKLLVLDFATGELRGSLDLHRPLTRTPVANETGQYLYVMADEASLFVVKLDPVSCVGVEYVGHDAGSIPCSPARVGRYLVVAENDGLNEGHWRVYLLDEDGPKLRPVQRLAVPGWTWSTPASEGQVIWMLSDRGGLTAYSLGPYDAKTPFQKIAGQTAQLKSTGPAFARTRGERQLWVASSLSARYDLDAQRGRLSTAWTRVEAGAALAPIQVAGRNAILTQQATEGRGVTLWGINPNTAAVSWKTTLGAPWPVALATGSDGESLSAIGLDGSPISISRDQLNSGGFIELTIPGPGDFKLPSVAIDRIEVDGATLLVPGSNASQIFVREGSGTLRTVDLPTPLGAAPLVWNHDLLIPGDDGRVYLIDPKTGVSKADPYVPPYDRAKPPQWRAPVVADGEAVALSDTAGRVRRLVRQSECRSRLVASGEEISLGSALIADPASIGSALLVATADGRVRALGGRDLSTLGAWPLDAPRALGPLNLGPVAIVADTSGALLAFEPDGQRRWAISLREGAPIGPPLTQQESLWILTKDGTIQRRALADGASLDRYSLGILPAGGPLALGQDVVVPAAPGTVRMLLKDNAPKKE